MDLENFHHGFLEECPWLLSERAGETDRRGLLKILEKVFFLESLGFCELSFAMLMMVRDNQLSCCSQARSSLFYFYLQRIDLKIEFLPFPLFLTAARQEKIQRPAEITGAGGAKFDGVAPDEDGDRLQPPPPPSACAGGQLSNSTRPCTSPHLAAKATIHRGKPYFKPACFTRQYGLGAGMEGDNVIDSPSFHPHLHQHQHRRRHQNQYQHGCNQPLPTALATTCVCASNRPRT